MLQGQFTEQRALLCILQNPKELQNNLGSTSVHESTTTSVIEQALSFLLDLNNRRPRVREGHAQATFTREPCGVHYQKDLTCVTFPCQLCDSCTHFPRDIFRVQLCVANSLPWLTMLPICEVIKLLCSKRMEEVNSGSKLGAYRQSGNLGFIFCPRALKLWYLSF